MINESELRNIPENEFILTIKNHFWDYLKMIKVAHERGYVISETQCIENDPASRHIDIMKIL